MRSSGAASRWRSRRAADSFPDHCAEIAGILLCKQPDLVPAGTGFVRVVNAVSAAEGFGNRRYEIGDQAFGPVKPDERDVEVRHVEVRQDGYVTGAFGRALPFQNSSNSWSEASVAAARFAVPVAAGACRAGRCA